MSNTTIPAEGLPTVSELMTTPRERMAAFDRLPKKIRQFIAEDPHDISARHAMERWRQERRAGRSAEDLVTAALEFRKHRVEVMQAEVLRMYRI